MPGFLHTFPCASSRPLRGINGSARSKNLCGPFPPDAVRGDPAAYPGGREFAVDTLKALAHRTREGNLAHDLQSLPLLALTIIGIVGFIAGTPLLPEKFIDSRRERVTFLAAFIFAVIISGYFYHLP